MTGTLDNENEKNLPITWCKNECPDLDRITLAFPKSEPMSEELLTD